MIGISWATSGGEATAIFNDKYLAADGIENCIKVLDEIENGNFGDDNLATYARGVIGVDTGAYLEINGGIFKAVKNDLDITAFLRKNKNKNY